MVSENNNYFTNRKLTNFEKFHKINELKKLSKGENVKIAIIDSGISPDIHIDKKEEMDMFNKGGVVEDGAGHGTAVASIIKRIAPNAEIYDFKVLDKNGVGTSGTVSDGFNLAKAWDVDIATISLGANHLGQSMVFENSLNALRKNKTIILGATGNNGHNGIDYPARYKDVWAIGSVNEKGDRSKFSNYGEVDFVALGEKLPTLSQDNNLIYKTGTSFSIPVMAGILALVMGHAKKHLIDTKSIDWYDLLKQGSYFSHSRSDFGNGYPRGDLLKKLISSLA